MNIRTDDTDGIVLVIFGVTGDLTRRKLIPALYELLAAARLPQPLQLVGFARRDWDDHTLISTFVDGVNEFGRSRPADEALLNSLVENAVYIQSTFSDLEGYKKLAKFLKDLKAPNVLFYLATPPGEYVDIIQNIGKSGILEGRDGWSRVVIEKPFGRDLETARFLDREVRKVFDEKQIYRIDHYLGKETVQNILVLRFANGIFEPLWNRRYVDHVQITVSEEVGVGTRAGYYEKAGVIRDMFQNHLLQLLTLTAMEAPVSLQEDAVRDEKVKVLRALRPLSGAEVTENTYRAQYVSGYMDGERVPGYKDEAGVSSRSVTETFLAARLYVDNWRWSGVPFYIRSGKRLPCRATEIAIQFRQVPLSLFNWHNMAGEAPNVLILNLQPNEGITLTFGAKAPGPVDAIAPASMRFSYKEAFGEQTPEAYERLLLDCLIGDATLFTRHDEVEAQWDFTSKLLDGWEKSSTQNLPVYEAGTWGPPGAERFIGQDKRGWHNLCPI
jgi:glucose-6-phosphate 1-dehydrogenase